MPDAARRLLLGRPVTHRSPARRTARLSLVDGTVEVTCRTRGAWAAFERLRRRGASAPDLAAIAAAHGPASAREWSTLLRELRRLGAIAEALCDAAGAPLCTVVPMQPAARPPSRSPSRSPSRPPSRSRRGTLPRGRPAVLSRFAYLRREGRTWELRSPLSVDRLTCDGAFLPILAALQMPQTAATLASAARCSATLARSVMRLLDASGMLTAVAPDGTTAEDASRSLAPWEFPDLLLQAHHRLGRHDGVVGAAYPFIDRWPPEPATVPPRGRRTIALPSPASAAGDVPLADVLEQRRSNRAYGDAPMTLAQLGELLWRSARVRARHPATADRPYDTTSRPYPSGGAAYPLEIIVTVGRCRGLARGIYHYDPVAHALGHLGAHRETVRALLDDARASQGAGDGAQVLLTFVARFRRLTWKYRAIAMATILKDVGALTQTLYLVATAMGLGPCGIGSGDATRLERVLGWPFHEASAVGELLVGSVPSPARLP